MMIFSSFTKSYSCIWSCLQLPIPWFDLEYIFTDRWLVIYDFTSVVSTGNFPVIRHTWTLCLCFLLAFHWTINLSDIRNQWIALIFQALQQICNLVYKKCNNFEEFSFENYSLAVWYSIQLKKLDNDSLYYQLLFTF